MGDPDFGRMNERSRALADKAQEWFDHVWGPVWGKPPVSRDETGRTDAGAPVNPPPAKPMPLTDATGRPVDETLKRIGAEVDRIVADAAEPEDEPAAVKALQRAINLAPRLAVSRTAPQPPAPKPAAISATGPTVPTAPALPGLQPALNAPNY